MQDLQKRWPTLRNSFYNKLYFTCKLLLTTPLMFRYSEKATNFEKNLPVEIWRYWVASNFKRKIFSNFVAFSEYPNFTCKLLLTTPLVHLFVMRSHCPLQSKKSQSLWFWHVTFSVMVLSGTESWCDKLTQRIWQIRPLCPWSKWNMGDILAFLA